MSSPAAVPPTRSASCRRRRGCGRPEAPRPPAHGTDRLRAARRRASCWRGRSRSGSRRRPRGLPRCASSCPRRRGCGTCPGGPGGRSATGRRGPARGRGRRCRSPCGARPRAPSARPGCAGSRSRRRPPCGRRPPRRCRTTFGRGSRGRREARGSTGPPHPASTPAASRARSAPAQRPTTHRRRCW